MISRQTGITVGLLISLLLFAFGVGKFWQWVTGQFAAATLSRATAKRDRDGAKVERDDLDKRLDVAELNIDRLQRPTK